MRIKKWTALLLGLVLAAGLLAGCSGGDEEGGLPAFTANTLEGGTFTQDDIAAAVSASRVTVSRVLNEFARSGWVELGYRTIRLAEPEPLKRLCQL